MASYFVDRWKLSLRRACRLVNLSRTVYSYQATGNGDSEVREVLKALALKHPKYGCPMLTVLVRAQGFQVNHKRIERLYQEENLMLRRKRKGRKFSVERSPLSVPESPCETWGIDFIHDHYAIGKVSNGFRCLTVLDLYSRFSLWLEPRPRYSSESVVYILGRLTERFGCPKSIHLDNGPEFRSDVFQEWAKTKGIHLAFSQPGKPQQNGFVESFHSRFRYECLSSHVFESLDQAQQIVEAWRHSYNHERPHSSLGGKPPASRMPMK